MFCGCTEQCVQQIGRLGFMADGLLIPKNLSTFHHTLTDKCMYPSLEDHFISRSLESTSQQMPSIITSRWSSMRVSITSVTANPDTIIPSSSFLDVLYELIGSYKQLNVYQTTVIFHNPNVHKNVCYWSPCKCILYVFLVFCIKYLLFCLSKKDLMRPIRTLKRAYFKILTLIV